MPKLRWKDVMAASVMQEHGRSVRSLARDLGVAESSLRERLRRHREGIEDGRRRQSEACMPWDEIITTWIAEHIERPGRPSPVKFLYDLLVCEYGYAGSYKAVLRYVRRRTPVPRMRPHRRVEVRPGTQVQVDWFEVPVHVEELGGAIRLHAFVMALSFSRMWAVLWSVSRDMLSWIRCHNEAFERLGGIALSTRIDNLRTGVASGAGPWAVINEGYADYASQVGFIVDPARARTGSDKGKVERRGRDVKRMPILDGERFTTLAELQRVTDERIEALSGELLCPVTGLSIRESWERELPHLAPLPLSFPEPFDVQVSRTVERDCLVWFEGRQYETPARYAGRPVTVRGCAGEVRIYDRSGELLRAYPRGTACRILLDRTIDDFGGDDRIIAPTPLGRLGREIVLERSWEWDAPRRSIDSYHDLVRRLS